MDKIVLPSTLKTIEFRNEEFCQLDVDINYMSDTIKLPKSVTELRLGYLNFNFIL
jgi:hypothetical protein